MHAKCPEQIMTRVFNYPDMWILQLGFRKWQLHQISFHLSDKFFFFSFLRCLGVIPVITKLLHFMFFSNLCSICSPHAELDSWLHYLFLWLVRCSHGCFWSFSSVINYHCDQIQSTLFASHTIALDCGSVILNCHHDWCSWLSVFFLSLHSCKSLFSLFLSHNSSKIPTVIF